jgi:hypothetical protein
MQDVLLCKTGSTVFDKPAEASLFNQPKWLKDSSAKNEIANMRRCTSSSHTMSSTM